MYLYRGVSEKYHQDSGGILKPKVVGAFTYNFHWGESGAYWDSGITWDSTPANAVIRHQFNQEGFPTSGISTTPHFERATIYARGKDGLSLGFIYKIARARLKEHDVREFIVADYAIYPSVPEDDEVILVIPNSQHLPEDLVIEIIPITGI
jgi:hypothetical protein